MEFLKDSISFCPLSTLVLVVLEYALKNILKGMPMLVICSFEDQKKEFGENRPSQAYCSSIMYV